MMTVRHMSSPATKFDTFKKNWLSDPGAYPVLVVLGVACTGCTVYGFYNLLNSPDVRITPTKRESVVRTWGAKNVN